MTEQKPLVEPSRVGLACAYTPLALIHAAGFVPHRILPQAAAPEQAGLILHDNLCPHVKRILDQRNFAAGQLRTRLQALVEMLLERRIQPCSGSVSTSAASPATRF